MAGFVVRGHVRKLANLRARPCVTVVFRSGWDWVPVEGQADLAGPDDRLDGLDPRVGPRLLREVHAAAAGGTIDDWAALDQVMAEERHTAVLIRVRGVYSNPARREAITADLQRDAARGHIGAFRSARHRHVSSRARTVMSGMESQPSLAGVGETALGMALMRAEETRRADRLFEDPYAEAFVDAAPRAFAEGPDAPDELALLGELFSCLTFQSVIRTRFFDDYLLGACRGGCHQVVLLAAGLDTRAFRLAWPAGMRVYELDLHHVQTWKEGVLAERKAVPRCDRIVVPVDLRQDWPNRLLEAGFESNALSAWLIEGLLIYLSAGEAARLLSTVGALASLTSQLALDQSNIADTPLLAQARAVASMDQFTSLWKGGLGEDAPDWLARQGWQTQTHDYAALARSYGRPIPAHVRGGVVAALRIDEA